MEERLSNSSGGGSGKSFLARQRQVHTRRTPGGVMSPHMTGGMGTRWTMSGRHQDVIQTSQECHLSPGHHTWTSD